MSTEEAKDKSIDLDAQLNEAAKAFDVDSCKRLINDGADAKKVFQKADSNSLHAGDSSSILFNAIRAFQQSKVNEADYVETVLLLLQNGADANFEAQVRDSYGVERYPVFKEAIKTISSLSSMQLKMKLVNAFVRNWWGMKPDNVRICKTPKIFDLVEEAGKSGNLDLVAIYLDLGMSFVDSVKWSWEGASDRGFGRWNKNRETLLHSAIQTQNVGLVQMLIEMGANVNENMIWTAEDQWEKRFWLISCLQLAMEIGNKDICDTLKSAGAEEVVDVMPEGVNLNIWTYWEWSKSDNADEDDEPPEFYNYENGGQGLWKRAYQEKQAKLMRRKKQEE